jgi:heparan-alpha-glucosaminide N-acetyltransferase
MEDPSPPIIAPSRLSSIDAYRGLVMFLMMAEVLHLSGVARAVNTTFWQFLAWHQSHVEWVGCSLHDMIQPSFSFLVGAALPFSIASRRAKGQSLYLMTLHAVWRAFLLIALGIFLRSTWKSQTNYTFEDTLTQIGLGYAFLFILGFFGRRVQWAAFALLLIGYWAAFALYAPPPDFDYAKVGVKSSWLAKHGLSGFASHWNLNNNLAWRVDKWFLNLFPREHEFLYNGGGYATLSFIPTLATMIMGLLAAGVLRSDRPSNYKMLWLAIAGAIAMSLGWLCDFTGVCPIVKRIWTPSWTLYSGGLCFLLLALFYAIVDLWKLRPPFFPLIVIGMNSIAAYVMAHLFEGFIVDALKRHLPAAYFTYFGKPCQPLMMGAAVLLALWLILFWMYRRKIFLRI